MARRYGRAQRGARVVAAVPHGHWKTTTFLAARRHDGLSAPCVFDGAINGARFLVASAGFSLMIARRPPAAKVSAPPPAVAKVPEDAPVPKVIMPMGEPFLWMSSTVSAVAVTPA